MTTTVAAEKKDEKVEKRKALGRGLASLLPGPRVVASTEARGPSGGAGGADSVFTAVVMRGKPRSLALLGMTRARRPRLRRLRGRGRPRHTRPRVGTRLLRLLLFRRRRLRITRW